MALLPVAEAQAHILEDVAPLGAESVALAMAAGRTLARDVEALRSQPPVDVSSMDGYAVHHEDVLAGAALRVIGEAVAGRGFEGKVGRGEAVRIFTGGSMPAGADAVLIQENAVRDGDMVTASGTLAASQNVRRAGLDFALGDTLLRADSALDFRHLALLAAMGHGDVQVRRRPRVAILATGDELVPPGGDTGADRIVASSGYAVAALVTAAGGEPIDLGIARDDLAEIRRRLRHGADSGADVLVVLGGASVGDHDLTRPALEAEGVAIAFWKLALRPGKPMMFGRRGPVRAFGLPGNPVSSVICTLLFVQPLVRALLGRADPLPRLDVGRLAVPVRANDHREDYMRAGLEWDEAGVALLTPFERQDSSMLGPLAAAGALLLRLAHAPAGAQGDPCRFLRF